MTDPRGVAWLAVAAANLLLGACMVGPNYRAPTSSDLGVPSSYYGSNKSESPELLKAWWTQLGDAELDKIVSTALAANLDLEVARARLRQARESVIQANADLLPTASASGTARPTIDSHGHVDTNYSLSGDASWEADLFGGTRRSIEASRSDAQASAYDLASTRVSLIADVANYYLQARLAQAQEELARQSQSVEEDNLQIARWRLQAGLVSSLDVEQARGQLAQTSATIPNYQKTFSNAAFRLGVLTGQAPEALIEELKTGAGIPQAPQLATAGVPADTLRQRPDVRSAERSLAAATARIGVAAAELYPHLQIGGTISTSALSLANLVSTITGSLFATLTQAIFNGGRTRSQIRSQEAAAEGAFANYKKSVLNALEDVENALVALKSAAERGQQYAIALDAARNQELLARTEYRSGRTDFRTLLEAERSLLSANQSLAVSRGDKTLAVIQLYRAAGGGWNPDDPAGEQTR